MPPKITSTWSCWTSFIALASPTLSVVSLSSRYSSILRPNRPPLALMSSITILATFALAIPMNERAPVWSVITPTLIRRAEADSSIAFSPLQTGLSGLDEELVPFLLMLLVRGDRRDDALGHLEHECGVRGE